MGKKIPLWAVLLVLLFAVLTFVYSRGILAFMGLPCGYGDMHMPLILSTIVAAIVAVAYGWKWNVLEKGMLDAIGRPMQALLIMLAVGIMISTWIAGGIVPSMIYYGLKILTPTTFLMSSCVLCLIIALATGSSWTTIGTVGLALIGIGTTLGFSAGATAGAAIVGAYAGDKMSPLSDTTLMAPAVAGTNVMTHIRHMMWTVTPSFLISLVVFLLLGLRANANANLSQIASMQNALLDNFTISPLLLIPPILVLGVVIMKAPALPGMFLGIIAGAILGSITQKIPMGDWFGIMHYGFSFSDSTGIDPFVVSLLERGGMSSMLWTFNMTICVMCFAGVMDASGMMGTLTEALLKGAKGRGSLVLVTILTCITVNVVACSQYLSILLTGRMYKRAFEDAKLRPENLSRILEDAGTVTSPLVPWNSCGVTILAMIGVPTVEYFRYAVLCYVNPIVSAIYGYTGFTMTKLTDEEYEKILAQRAEDEQKELAAAT